MTTKKKAPAKVKPQTDYITIAMMAGLVIGGLAGFNIGIFSGHYFAANDSDYRRSTEAFKSCVWNNAYLQGADQTAITIRKECLPLTRL